MDIDSDTYSPSPGTSSEPAQVPADYSTARHPGAGAKTEPQVSAESPIDVDDSDLEKSEDKFWPSLTFHLKHDASFAGP